MTEPSFRTATIGDLPIMLDWAAGEGWNPGIGDAKAFFAADPGGFFMAEVAGRPVASISVVNHSETFAFLGLYICRPGFRGQGIGFDLWNHALAHAGSRVVGLDGVAAQEANYAKSGFVRTGATVRFEGSLPPGTSDGIIDLRPADVPALLALDARANGISRPAFLTEWLSGTANRQTVAVSEGDRPTGFATIRACREGAKIGPIVAPDPETGWALARAAAKRLPAERTIVDVPSGNADFAEILKRHGFSETFATARMYRGSAPHAADCLMAIATMELG
jgi:GNAT superfamily N-acetyltransferase